MAVCVLPTPGMPDDAPAHGGRFSRASAELFEDRIAAGEERVAWTGHSTQPPGGPPPAAGGHRGCLRASSMSSVSWFQSASCSAFGHLDQGLESGVHRLELRQCSASSRTDTA